MLFCVDVIGEVVGDAFINVFGNVGDVDGGDVSSDVNGYGDVGHYVDVGDNVDSDAADDFGDVSDD